MSEPPVQPEPPDTPSGAIPEGSIAGGIVIAWAIFLFGHALELSLPLGLLIPLPELAIVALAILCFRKGRKRTGNGLLLGLASIAAVVLLLVAACFGLVFTNSYR